MELISLLFIMISIIVCWCISIYNRIKRLYIKIGEADSGIDVALNKRYNVLTKMIDVVKSYTKYENETIMKTIKLRSNMSILEKVKVNDELNKTFDRVTVIAENYPELKSSDNYKVLQNAIIDVEDHLQAAIRIYNSNVSRYNQVISVFPNNVIAKNNGFSEKSFFELETEKKDIEINL